LVFASKYGKSKLDNRIRILVDQGSNLCLEKLRRAEQARGITVTCLGTLDISDFEIVSYTHSNEILSAINGAKEQNKPFAVVFLNGRGQTNENVARLIKDIIKVDALLCKVIVTDSIGAHNQLPADIDLKSFNVFCVSEPDELQIYNITISLSFHWLNEQRAILQKLTEILKQRSIFVDTLTHEMRTNLTIIKNVISNARAGMFGPLKEKMVENLYMANNKIVTLAKISNDLFTLCKTASSTLQLVRVQAGVLLQECI
jgi:signal transduction histidine kinase